MPNPRGAGTSPGTAVPTSLPFTLPWGLKVGSVLFGNVKVLECIIKDFQVGDDPTLGILKTSDGYFTPQKFWLKTKIKGCTHTHTEL